MNRVTLLGVLQLVRIDVGRERASDISGGHLRALGLAKEDAELVLQSDGGGEDGWALLLRDAVLILLLGATATTTSLLDLLGDALLETLEGLDGRHSLVTLGLEGRNQGGNLLVDGLHVRRRGGLGDSRSDGGGSDGRGNRDGRDGRLRRGGFLGLLSDRGRGGNSGNLSNGGIGFLGDFLRNSLGRLAHCTSTGGIS